VIKYRVLSTGYRESWKKIRVGQICYNRIGQIWMNINILTIAEGVGRYILTVDHLPSMRETPSLIPTTHTTYTHSHTFRAGLC
jgi:hypothetical protein